MFPPAHFPAVNQTQNEVFLGGGIWDLQIMVFVEVLNFLMPWLMLGGLILRVDLNGMFVRGLASIVFSHLNIAKYCYKFGHACPKHLTKKKMVKKT
mmetsp:Transcript_8029/g.16210  ORF Transcript_8029/g.16210 Transcript_8029/m.16210 type:complete len:96 (+) Transcript_8029:654-941(+)